MRMEENSLPILDITFDDVRDAIAAYKEWYEKQKAEYYAKGGRGRFSIRPKEEIQADRERYKQKLINDAKRYAIDSYDFSMFVNDEYRERFRTLIKEYNAQQQLYKNSTNYNTTNNTGKTTKVYCTSWLNWLSEVSNIFGYKLPDDYIHYNDMHYAVRDVDDIYIKGEFLPKAYINGKLIVNRYGTRQQAIDVVKRYCKLFYNIPWPNKNFDSYVWSIMEFIKDTVEINNYIISPFDVYEQAVKIYSSKSRSRVTVKPLGKHRLQKVFYEPGYKEEARANYNLHKDDVLKHKILVNIKGQLARTGTINIKEVQSVVLGQIDLVIDEEHIVDIENGSYRDGQAHIEYKDDRKLRKIINELIKENRLNGKISQSRSAWHTLVKDGCSFEEIKEKFPTVEYNTYKAYRYRLSKRVQ